MFILTSLYFLVIDEAQVRAVSPINSIETDINNNNDSNNNDDNNNSNNNSNNNGYGNNTTDANSTESPNPDPLPTSITTPPVV